MSRETTVQQERANKWRMARGLRPLSETEWGQRNAWCRKYRDHPTGHPEKYHVIDQLRRQDGQDTTGTMKRDLGAFLEPAPPKLTAAEKEDHAATVKKAVETMGGEMFDAFQ